MREHSKILLSKNEILVLKEENFFLTKRIITQKIFLQLAEAVKTIQASSSFSKISFPTATDITSGKISKGENYLGLPFVILDFPKLFSREKILAFRTMIWWGNFVSCSLLVSGIESMDAGKKLIRHFSVLKEKNVFLCVNESPWHHHFGKQNFLPLKSINKNEADQILKQQGFVKVARKIPITQINRLQEFSAESFDILSGLLL